MTAFVPLDRFPNAVDAITVTKSSVSISFSQT